MSQCNFKTGIFVQRPCLREAKISCSVCRVQVCERHDSESSEGDFCLECAPSRNERHDTNALVDGRTTVGMWYWSTRDRHYNEYDGVAFDLADYNSFDTTSLGDVEYGDSDDDFFDS